ncbi:MAG: bifunctional DNA-formamidopyrimidine glycosylase/DNA-(apurinic or apyrimidinic site) lyase [Alphaproteobacteria bacterium]|nr:bifunctional DNA-formamidopyrimidine glycosylase/DNA-(apurinic or apyrimidinic site) lyase [Alphaproteobacteria bacterium]
MPELPEVETIKNAVQQTLKDAVFLEVQINNPCLRKPVQADLPQILQNAKIIQYRRIAKYLILNLDNGYSLILHFGMSGTLRLSKNRGKILKHDHLVFATNKGYMIYNDPRRFGLCLYERTDTLEKNPLFRGIGIDPFDDALTARWFKKNLENRVTPIKQVLLDQKIICGIGNIYASEALYLAGILPTRSASSLTLKECENLLQGIRKTLSLAVQAGGSTLKDYRKPDGSLGYFQNSHCVYNKTGQTCPNCICDVKKTGGIKKIIQSGRSTYFCATKQR